MEKKNKGKKAALFMVILLVLLLFSVQAAHSSFPATWRGYVKISNASGNNLTAQQGTVIDAYVNDVFAARATVKNISTWDEGYYLVNVPGNSGDNVTFKVLNVSINGVNTTPQPWAIGVHPPEGSSDWFNLSISALADNAECTWNGACSGGRCCYNGVECNGQCIGHCLSIACPVPSPGAGGGGGGGGQAAEKFFYTNDNLSCENRNLADNDGDNVTIAGYNWFNGTMWLGVNSKNLSAFHTRKNQEWKCAITLDDSYVQVEINSSAIKISNAPPVLVFMQNITINETEMVNLTPHAGDIDNDTLFFFYSSPINSSGQWRTSYESEGVHIITVTVSDGFLNDSQDMEINVLNTPVKGNISNISTNLNNLSIVFGNFSDVSLITTETVPIKFVQDNITVLSFTFNFSRGTLIFDRIRVDKQPNSSTLGYWVIKGINLTKQNLTKSVFVDNITVATGICIKDAEIESIGEITSTCKGTDEFWVACPGTNGQYSCEFNSSINMFRVSGLNHSGVIQQETYCGDGIVNGGESCSSCPEDAGSCTAPQSSGGGGGGGGSGGGGSAAASDSASLSIISSGAEGIFNFQNYDKLAVDEISISAAAEINSPRINIQETKLAEGMPSPSDSGGSSYKILSINKINFDNAQILGAIIKFKVGNQWILSNNIDSGTIVLKRLKGTSWEEMPTRKTGEDSFYANFESKVPGFSVFAITGLKAQSRQAELAEENESSVAETSQEEIKEGKNIVQENPESVSGQLEAPAALTGAAVALPSRQKTDKLWSVVVFIVIAIVGIIALKFFQKRRKYLIVKK